MPQPIPQSEVSFVTVRIRRRNELEDIGPESGMEAETRILLPERLASQDESSVGQYSTGVSPTSVQFVTA